MVLICNWCWQRQADKGQCEGVCESSFWESKVRDPVVFMLCDNVYGLAILQGANIKEQTKMNTSQANMKPPQMTKKWWMTRKGSGPGREVLIISLEWWQTFHSHWLRPQSWKWKRIVRLSAFFGRSTEGYDKGDSWHQACQCDQEWKQRNLQEMQTSVSGGLMWMQSWANLLCKYVYTCPECYERRKGPCPGFGSRAFGQVYPHRGNQAFIQPLLDVLSWGHIQNHLIILQLLQ